jgi:bacterioferritin (cytochrome b1)
LHADQVIDRIIRLSGDPDGTASLRARRNSG